MWIQAELKMGKHSLQLVNQKRYVINHLSDLGVLKGDYSFDDMVFTIL